MEKTEMLEEQTNETEKTETETADEILDGVELTDTSDVEEFNDELEEPTNEKEKVKLFTQEEVDNIVKRRLSRKDKEYQKTLSKYLDTEEVLKKTIGGEDIEEVNKNLRDAYQEQGFELPEPIKPSLSQREIEILAKADAEDIIDEGYEAMQDEANRLANIGYENMTNRERVIFTTLCDKLTIENDVRELKKLGAKEDLLDDKEFIDFRKLFVSNVPIEKIYDMYKKSEPKPKAKNPGSMKNTTTQSDIKEYYTPEEAKKFTRKDYDKNPKLLEAVERSMTKWIE